MHRQFVIPVINAAVVTGKTHCSFRANRMADGRKRRRTVGAKGSLLAPFHTESGRKSKQEEEEVEGKEGRYRLEPFPSPSARPFFPDTRKQAAVAHSYAHTVAWEVRRGYSRNQGTNGRSDGRIDRSLMFKHSFRPLTLEGEEIVGRQAGRGRNIMTEEEGRTAHISSSQGV